MENSLAAVALIPILISVALSVALKINMKKFQFYNLVLLSVSLGISYFYIGGGFLAPLLAAFVFFLATVLAMGWWGPLLQPSDYALIQSFGLFPWYLGGGYAIGGYIAFAPLLLLILFKPKLEKVFRRKTSPR